MQGVSYAVMVRSAATTIIEKLGSLIIRPRHPSLQYKLAYLIVLKILKWEKKVVQPENLTYTNIPKDCSITKNNRLLRISIDIPLMKV